MVNTPANAPTAAHAAAPSPQDSPPLPPLAGRSGAPLCYVVDDENSMRHFLSLVLHGSGIDTEEFAEGRGMCLALARQLPDVVFLNISLESAEAIECVIALGKYGFTGPVQLMSGRGAAVLEHVKNVGLQHRLQMLPVLKKPFETEASLRIIDELRIGTITSTASNVSLEQGLTNGWVEFWYQPKIGLRKKQLAGAEIYARILHPEHGVILPGGFLPNANEATLVQLSELALVSALRAGKSFTDLGLKLPITVNIPMPVLTKLPIEQIVRAQRSAEETWAGLVIDIPEPQVMADLPAAIELTKTLAALNIRVAIDDFGNGISTMARLKDMPFAELKLDQTHVTDCGTDKIKAPLCKTVIDLAHNFGSTAVAVGIEKAADAMALVSMGCDFGQGFLLGQPMAEERFISLLRQRAANQGAKLPDLPKAPEKRRA
jgi:EAL domain-containing protein (putative c-di-GMP-specific phosphodiesterase class I)